jgi:hypothetical protein
MCFTRQATLCKANTIDQIQTEAKHTPWSFVIARKRKATHTQTASRGRTGIVTTMVSARAAALVGITWMLLLLLLMDLVGMLMMTTVMPVRHIRIFVAVKQVDTSTASPCSPRGLGQVRHAVGVMLMLVSQTTTPTRVTAFHGRIVASCHGTRGTRIAVRLTKLVGRRWQVGPHHAAGIVVIVLLCHDSIDRSLAL